jgi:hypothetical protein
MSEVPAEIVGSWLHSFEEDTAAASVYRPDDYPFQLSRRVRDGLEFRSDGTLVEHRGGPDDRLRGDVGRWQDGGANSVQISFPQGRRAPFDITVLSCTNDVLTIAKG